MRMHQVVFSIVSLALSANIAVAQGSTAFSYQGRLQDAGAPANGTFDVQFSLWDDLASGNQVGLTNAFNSLPILEGLFTVELDFGADAFNNNDRWLEITVDGVPLVPRQPITRTPYAIQTRGIVVNESGRVGIGTDDPEFPLHVEDDFNITAIYGGSNAIDGSGVHGQTTGVFGSGVYGVATAVDGINYGGLFESNSTSGRGVYGLATAATGANYGVLGRTNSTSGHGVFGEATALSGQTYGGYFLSESTSGLGVFGRARALTGLTYGVYGVSFSNSGSGVSGWANSTTGTTTGGRFVSSGTSGRGVYGWATSSTGTNYGGRFKSDSASGYGVFGWAAATTGTNYGVFGSSNSASGYAGYFEGRGNDAMYIENIGSGRGLRAVAPSDTAVWALTETGFAGVHGQNASTSGLAVYGQATATTGTNYGVYGKSNSANGYDFYAGGAGVNYGAASSRRWKNNVVPISDPLRKLSQLRGVYFDWDDKHGGARDVGMIAEEVGAILPEIVQFEDNGIDASGMDYSKMTPLLVEAVNALRVEKDSEIRAMKAIRAETDGEIAAQAMRLTKLERKNSKLSDANVALQNRLDSLERLIEQLASTAKEQPK